MVLVKHRGGLHTDLQLCVPLWLFDEGFVCFLMYGFWGAPAAWLCLREFRKWDVRGCAGGGLNDIKHAWGLLSEYYLTTFKVK